MATTLVNASFTNIPAFFEPVKSQTYFRAISIPSTAVDIPGFRYVMDVNVWGTSSTGWSATPSRVARINVPAQPLDGAGIFSPHRILEPRFKPKPYPKTNTITWNTEMATRYKLGLGVGYDPEWVGTSLRRGPAVSSEAAWNAAKKPDGATYSSTTTYYYAEIANATTAHFLTTGGSESDFVGIASKVIGGGDNNTPSIIFGDNGDGSNDLLFSFLSWTGATYTISDLMLLTYQGYLYLYTTPVFDPSPTQYLTRNAVTGQINYTTGGGGGVNVYDEGVLLSTTPATSVDFVGTNVYATQSGTTATVYITGFTYSNTLFVDNNGSTLTALPGRIDFPYPSVADALDWLRNNTKQGWTIWVFPGFYNETRQWQVDSDIRKVYIKLNGDCIINFKPVSNFLTNWTGVGVANSSILIDGSGTDVHVVITGDSDSSSVGTDGAHIVTAHLDSNNADCPQILLENSSSSDFNIRFSNVTFRNVGSGISETGMNIDSTQDTAQSMKVVIKNCNFSTQTSINWWIPSTDLGRIIVKDTSWRTQENGLGEMFPNWVNLLNGGSRDAFKFIIQHCRFYVGGNTLHVGRNGGAAYSWASGTLGGGGYSLASGHIIIGANNGNVPSTYLSFSNNLFSAPNFVYGGGGPEWYMVSQAAPSAVTNILDDVGMSVIDNALTIPPWIFATLAGAGLSAIPGGFMNLTDMNL